MMLLFSVWIFVMALCGFFKVCDSLNEREYLHMVFYAVGTVVVASFGWEIFTSAIHAIASGVA